MHRILSAFALAVIACLALPSASDATNGPAVYTGKGFTLTLNYGHVSYGYVEHGTLRYRGRQYHVEGDHVPAGDAGGELLRFYGHPFGSNSPLGLISVDTLYNACIPNCAAGRTYDLNTIMSWTLPGSNLHHVRLTIHG